MTMRYRYEELAGMIDHALLHPALTDRELDEGCRLAVRYRVASVCIKPCGVARAAALLAGSGVAVGTVIGFPHGGAATETKRHETALACNDGAAEIDMVINIGKALGGDWDAVERDVAAVCDEARRHSAPVKAILETGYLGGGGGGLSGDELKRQLCRICERAGAAWVKTSTGFGFVARPGGGYDTTGATFHDLALMRGSVSPAVQVKASGGVRDLDSLIRVRELGCSRCGTSATATILDEYRRRAAAAAAGSAAPHGEPPRNAADAGY